MRYLLLFSFFFLLAIGNSTAQSLERSIALLDLSERNAETNDAQIFSAEHILKVSGIPFSITSNPIIATQYAMILCSSYLDPKTLSGEEKNNLIAYISNGGIVVAPRVIDDFLYPLFGVSGNTESNSNYLLNWNNSLTTSLFRWIDEPEEWTISFGRVGGGAMFKTVSYDLGSATALAHFDNGTVAVTQNQFGDGFAYNFGFTWKEVILRSQINRDIEAQRISSNGFEPSMDVIMLMIRAIFIEHIPYTTWKHTSAQNSTSTLMVTHDIDSNTGMVEMINFADSELNKGFVATYNITVRYLSDALMTDFYNGNQDNMSNVVAKGHIIGSHSVGHFPDFGDDDVFPIGSTGNTTVNYRPYNNAVFTTGGTVYGECEVSKNLLETDLGVDVRIFRTGHLVYNKYLVEVLEDLGYEYNSSYSANEVLTNFPYQNKKGRSFSGENSSVYELPASISDVYHDDPISEENYLDKADSWLDIISKIDANNASTVLLIHPNREYKLLGQEYLIANLPETINIEEMGAYGDYWKDREAFDFTSEITGNSLQINLTDQDLLLNDKISLIINNGQNLDDVFVMSESNNPLEFISENWGINDLILYNFKFPVGISDLDVNSANLNVNIYPNPIRENINIDVELKHASDITIDIFDIYGHLITNQTSFNQTPGKQNLSIDIRKLQLKSGVYFCRIDAGSNGLEVRKVVIR